MPEQELPVLNGRESSNAVREIISSDPGFWVRNGTVIFFILLLLSGLCSWFIKYPEIISSNTRLTGTHAPKPIVTHQAGRLIRLFKQNGDRVYVNDIIGCIETTADWQQVLILTAMIDTLSNALREDNYPKIAQLMASDYQNLGELQNAYQVFKEAYVPYRDYVSGNFASKKMALIHRDQSILEQNKKNLREQKQLYERDASLIQTTLDKNEQLLKDKIISEQEYRQLSSQSIGKKIPLQEVQSHMLNIEAEQNNKQKEILELDNQTSTQQVLFRNAAYNFKSAVDQWKHTYLLTSSVEGQLYFTTFLEENQQFENGQTLAYVTPKGGSYYLQMFIPQGNFGKIEKGQKVLLKFPAYSWRQYGSVTGRITYISPIPTDSGYLTRVILPNGLITSHKKQIIYCEGLTAQAEIITKDLRLLERIYQSITGNQ